MPELIVIGASTGGPEALASVFKNIHKKINVPMLIVQHMPPIFTEKLAMMLNKLSPIEVREAKVGDTLSPGFCYIAPGDFHMKLDLGGKIILDQSDKVCFVRPSVDVLLNSIVQNYNKKVLFIMLTGMGEDGAVAARKLKDKNGNIFIQDRESSVVWGMPGATKRNVPESHVIKLDQIGTLIEMNG